MNILSKNENASHGMEKIGYFCGAAGPGEGKQLKK